MHAFIWKLSAIALMAGNSLDSASSYGHKESNPLLAQNGMFTARSVGIKFGVVGGLILMQRKHKGRAFAVANFAGAGALTGLAVRNWRMK